jgi:tetratricopeptide (TPR) repeat protein
MKGLVFLFLIAFSASAQVDTPETLQVALEKAASPQERIDLLNRLSHVYTQLSLENAEQFANDALESAKKIAYKKGIASSYNVLGICSSIRGDYTNGLDYFIQALRLREDMADSKGVAHTLNNISRLFIYQKDYDKALEYAGKSLDILKKEKDGRAVGNAQISLGSIYISKGDQHRALEMFNSARDNFIQTGSKNHEGWVMLKIANAWEAGAQYDKALDACFVAMHLLDSTTDLFTTVELYQTTGSIYLMKGDLKEAAHYLHTATRLADAGKDNNGSMNSRKMLSEVFRKYKMYDSALYYNDQYLALHKDVFSAEKSRQLATLEKIYQLEKKDQLLALKNQKIESQSLIITTFSILIAVLIVLGFIVYRYYRDKKKSHRELEKLNREIYEKHEEILAQAEELTQANQEISRINESLEAEVTYRTDKIERQNKILIEYAFSNAHNVRGPLARILGLASLMSMEDDPELLKEYNTYIYVSAQELDNVIRAINIKLQDGT